MRRIIFAFLISLIAGVAHAQTVVLTSHIDDDAIPYRATKWPTDTDEWWRLGWITHDYSMLPFINSPQDFLNAANNSPSTNVVFDDYVVVTPFTDSGLNLLEVVFRAKCILDDQTGKCIEPGPQIKIPVTVRFAGRFDVPSQWTLLSEELTPSDNTPPSFVLSGNPNVYTNTNPIELTLTASDPSSEIGVIDGTKLNITGTADSSITAVDELSYLVSVTPIGTGPIGFFVPDNHSKWFQAEGRIRNRVLKAELSVDADFVRDGSLNVADQLRGIFAQSDFGSRFNLLRFKTQIDALIDPEMDAQSVMDQVDSLDAKLRSLIPAGSDEATRLQILRQFMYKAGPWNNDRPFHYDREDPYGMKVENKALASYLDKRAGNCVTMPVLFSILGNRLGLDMGLALAPRHVLVRYKDFRGRTHNLETTSGAGSETLAHYRKFLPISETSIDQEVYFKRLSNRQTAALMSASVIDMLMNKGDYSQAIQVVDFLIEQHPKFVWAMTIKADAIYHILMRDFMQKYSKPQDVPAQKRAELQRLAKLQQNTVAAAQALGWQPVNTSKE